MRNMKSAIAVLTVVTGCSIVWVGATTNVAAASTSLSADEPKSEGDRSRRVCRSVEPTGSRFAQRVCRTQQEWDDSAQRERNAQEKQSREGRNGQTVNAPN